MLCAAELLLIKEQAMNEKRERERIRREERIERTINFCENEINSALLDSAKKENSYKIECSIECKICNDRIHLVCKDGKKYKDGTLSYTWSTTEDLDLPMLQEYLDKYCLQIKIADWNFNSYGNGNYTGHIITVTPKCECLKED